MPPPDRWDKYSPLGQVIPKTTIFACKVPLREPLLNGVEERNKFSPSILINTLKDQGLNLGLIIDLTFTHKYYDKEEFTKDEIRHKKIFVKGHVIPSDSVFLEFADAVKSCDQEGSVIGVHCTHGVNRTGYLVCRYMIEELKIDPEEAIALFNEARGHNIERENYLQDLRTRQPGQSRLSVVEADHDRSSEKPSGRRKERWRSHKEDHPGWHRSSDSTRSGSYSDRHQGGRAPDHSIPQTGSSFLHGASNHFDDGNRKWYNSSNGVGQDPHSFRDFASEGASVQSFQNPGSSTNRNRSFKNQRPSHSGYDNRHSSRSYHDREEQSRYQQAGWGTSSSHSQSGQRNGRGWREDNYRSSDSHYPRRGGHYRDKGNQEFRGQQQRAPWNDQQRYEQAGWGHGGQFDRGQRRRDGGSRDHHQSEH